MLILLDGLLCGLAFPQHLRHVPSSSSVDVRLGVQGTVCVRRPIKCALCSASVMDNVHHFEQYLKVIRKTFHFSASQSLHYN